MEKKKKRVDVVTGKSVKLDFTKWIRGKLKCFFMYAEYLYIHGIFLGLIKKHACNYLIFKPEDAVELTKGPLR